jgi:surface antigen
VAAADAPLWPLSNGREALFRASVERQGGTKSDDVWSCRVGGPETARVPVGEFAAWRLACDVLRGADRRAETVVAHYAPAVRWFVRLEISGGGTAPRVAELTNLLTVDPPLPASATGRREAAMQAALESLPSGRDASWRDPSSGLAGKVRPVRTFKAGNGRFCREFEEDTASAERFDRNRRLACRDPAGEWVEIENS